MYVAWTRCDMSVECRSLPLLTYLIISSLHRAYSHTLGHELSRGGTASGPTCCILNGSAPNAAFIRSRGRNVKHLSYGMLIVCGATWQRPGAAHTYKSLTGVSGTSQCGLCAQATSLNIMSKIKSVCLVLCWSSFMWNRRFCCRSIGTGTNVCM